MNKKTFLDLVSKTEKEMNLLISKGYGEDPVIKALKYALPEIKKDAMLKWPMPKETAKKYDGLGAFTVKNLDGAGEEYDALVEYACKTVYQIQKESGLTTEQIP